MAASGLKALVVEDDIDGQEVLFHWLDEWGIGVDVVSDAETALEVIHQQRYDAFIIDLALPGIDGVTLLETLRHSQGNTPCIAITAFGNNGVRHHALEAGFDAYIDKPIDSEVLYAEIAHLLKL